MTDFIPSKRELRESLLYSFRLKRKVVDAHHLLCLSYGEDAPSIKSCEYWYRRFKKGDFNLDDKERPGQPKKFKDKDLKVLLKGNPSQTQEKLAKKLGVTQRAISKRLKKLGFIQKQGKWVAQES